MLLQFSFGNFRSFRDRVTLDMTAASRLHKDTDAVNDGNVARVGKLDVLRVAAIYGANASGKSNVGLALLNCRNSVGLSANTDFAFQAIPYFLDTTSTDQPTSYEVVFLLESVQYRYGFELQTGETPRIISEWLFEATASRETMVFERDGDKVARGRRFTEGGSLLNKGVLRRNESLYLSLMAQNGLALSSRLVDYLFRQIKIVSGLQDKGLHEYTVKCLKKGRFQRSLSQLMQDADTGIVSVLLNDDIDSDDIDIDIEAISGEDISDSDRGRLSQFVKEQMRVGAVHKVFDAEGVEHGEVMFPLLVNESMGTRKLFAFAGPVLDTLQNGSVLFVDEMDARFHPNLTRALVGLFQSDTANPKNAQLIFITHDTNLLDKRFRRDQIWFVEKDRLGASHLYSLAEIKGVREPDENDYIRGKYGAIPFLGG